MLRILFTHSVLRKTRAAIAFDVLAGVVIFVHLGLASGMPWGELTWGGAYPGVLPPHMRGVSLFSALLLLAFAYEVSARAGLVRLRLKTSAKTIWVVVGYSALGAFMNIITPSFWERVIWLPLTLGLLACSFVVAKKEKSHSSDRVD